jgi:outer membrane protein OmpA-like peptidoglycan-associated protein
VLAPLIGLLIAAGDLPGSLAHAQDATAVPTPELDSQLYRMPIDAEATLWTNDAGTAPTNHFMGRFALNYMKDPLVYRYADGTEVAVVSDVLTGNLMGAYTWEFLRFGLDVPVYMAVAGDAFTTTGGLGDMALDVKGSILDREGADWPVGLAVLGRLSLPTTTVDAPVGAGGVGWELQAILDHRTDKTLLAANLGTRGGPDVALGSVEWGDQFLWRLGAAWFVVEDAGLSADLAGSQTYGSPISEAAGKPVEGILGGFGRVSESVVLRGGVGTGLNQGIGAPDVRLIAAVGYEPREVRDKDGDGLRDKVDACPTEPEDKDGFKDDDGCPDPTTQVHIMVRDHNGDLVYGATTQLQTEAGTREGGADFTLPIHPGEYLVRVDAPRFAGFGELVAIPGVERHEVVVELEPLFGEVRVVVVDAEGRPLTGQAQVDGDDPVRVSGGVARAKADAGRRAVTVRVDGFKTRTVPVTVIAGELHEIKVQLEPAKAKVTKEKIEILEKVFFDTGRATIKEASFALLDDVAAILVEYPDIRRIQIEGHTDSRGRASTNKRLSQARADSVMKYLEGKGVEPGRMVAVGFGEDRPIDPANNAAAWEQNRRVEFVILERDAQ